MKKCAALSVLVTVILLILAVITYAQQPKKVPRIGFLSSFDPTGESERFQVIRLALRKLGYIEGQNIAMEYRYTGGNFDRIPEVAAEVVRLKVDIIVVAGGTTWVRAVKNATKTIPIVMVGAGRDPVEAGLVESLARPGGNVTGVTNLTSELGGKRLELFKERNFPVSRFSTIQSPRASQSS
jgi:ABC-type uncharacterized transport system substrate-binding protein